ncbi:putative mRNA 3-end processing factor [Chitinophaga costaii]|uniref:Putative mRNA 3-end processing factor n=1 Tax=Chitinophaga costaii TaxID=1335309 RepID=A0A1C4C1W2_9BACT|nr:ligase-associated DNA damage response exonuclease [Chitinophaga costaii]PUZ27370.1 ligase-associated DNA damage response exonuclease [Chitinophaga costaii]SCC13085.1 putative mRNA 3-end processing factor [Chitinophaga costaii]
MLQFTDKGIYCPAGDFYIDPWLPVERAVITHAHSDHARWGSRKYLCQEYSVPLLKLRLGADLQVQGLPYGESVYFNSVQVSFHPAGHMIGSAQVRIALAGEVWVVSGDYKVEHDGLSTPFEPVTCHTFITESTFGLPIYRWQPQTTVFAGIQQWIQDNQAAGKASVLSAYSLGKAQRLLYNLRHVTGRFLVHGAIAITEQVVRDAGWPLPAVERITPQTPKEAFANAVIICPPSAVGSSWMRRFTPYSLGVCSGWMQVRGNMRRRNADAGFVLSDHADWEGLLQAVKATGAQRVYVTHGFSSVFARYLTEQGGLDAAEIKTAFGDEEEDTGNEPDTNHTVAGNGA